MEENAETRMEEKSENSGFANRLAVVDGTFPTVEHCIQSVCSQIINSDDPDEMLGYIEVLQRLKAVE